MLSIYKQHHSYRHHRRTALHIFFDWIRVSMVEIGVEVGILYDAISFGEKLQCSSVQIYPYIGCYVESWVLQQKKSFLLYLFFSFMFFCCFVSMSIDNRRNQENQTQMHTRKRTLNTQTNTKRKEQIDNNKKRKTLL